MKYIFLISFLLLSVTAQASEDIETISDISKWQHPVRQVLLKNKVILSKVELRNNKQFPVFFIKFPYDPQSSATKDYFNNLYLEVLEANSYWNYEFYDAEDALIIHIDWDKHKKEIKLDYEDIK